MVTLTAIRHAFPEHAGFCIDRKKGYGEYTFLHFFNSVTLLSGGELMTTKPHAVIVYDTRTPQYFKSETALVHDWMHFTGDITPLLSAGGLEVDRVYYPCQSDFITQITKECETEFFGEAACGEELIQLKLQELFIKLGRAVRGELEPEFDRQTRDAFLSLRAKVFSTAHEKWTVERMAREVGLSQSRFYSVYKSIYNTSPTADLIGARIDRAKNMLEFGARSIEEIAHALGYESTTHFIRQFKKCTGVSPSVFRKSQQ